MSNMNKVFLDISSKINNKRLARKALSLNRRFKPTHSNELNKMFDLVTELYFNDYKIEVSEVIEKVVDKTEFNGDRRLWDFVEPLLLLKRRRIRIQKKSVL